MSCFSTLKPLPGVFPIHRYCCIIVGMKDTSGDITLTEEFIRRTRDVGVPYRPSLPTPAGAARDGFVRTMTAAGLL